MTHYQNNKYVYELACYEDGEEISNLLEDATFEGNICLCYAKRPNAVASINKDGIKSAIVTAKEIESGKIKGVGICTINKMLINGVEENIAYLSGLRVNKDSTVNIIEAYKILENFCRENNVRYTFTTILEENKYAQKMLTKKRKLMPQYLKLSPYTVNIFKKNLTYKSEFKCEKVKIDEIEFLKEFIKKESKNKNFFPVFDFTNEDFYFLKNQDNEILACGKLWKQWDYKQLILKKYSPLFKLLRLISLLLSPLKILPVFPKEGSIIKYPTLSFVLAKDNNENYLVDLIKQVSHHVDNDFFVYASTKEFSKNIRSIKYKSIVYLVDWDKNTDINMFNNSDIHIECGLL